MSSFAVIFAAIAAVLVALSFIPGLKELVGPIVKLSITVITKIGEHLVEWIIWATKQLLGAHIVVLTHLLNTRKALDPADALREDKDAEDRKSASKSKGPLLP